MQINLEVKDRIDAVIKAIEARRLFREEPDAAHLREQIQAEEMICIQSRALYSKFIDTSLWRGEVDREAVEMVRNALSLAKKCLTADENCRNAVNARLSDF